MCVFVLVCFVNVCVVCWCENSMLFVWSEFVCACRFVCIVGGCGEVVCILDVKGWHKVYRAGAIGVPHFLVPLQEKNGNIFKPSMYLGQFIVSAVLALDAIPRCKVVLLGQMRSVTLGLLLQTQFTKSTSSIDLAIRNPFRKVTFQFILWLIVLSQKLSFQ